MDTSALWIITLYAVITLAVGQAPPPVIQTTNGPVRGRPIEQDIGDTTVFLGIPYARAPTGNLRFAAPKVPISWTKPRGAEQPGPSCYQSVDTLKELYTAADVKVLSYDEDCLNLNVFIPGVGDVKNKDPLAVLVWFGGRTYDTSAPNMEPPFSLSSHGNIVVVTVNYRVGVLGYYTTGNEVINGNMALLDQQMALRWVQENIANFAGDKERVTIAGDGVGAMAVSLHVLSESSSGLFARAISFGSAMTQQYVPRPENMSDLSDVFAKSLGCRQNDSTDVVKCLRGKSAKEINAVRAQFSFVVDGSFLKDDPYILWNKTIPNPVDYVIGCSSYDVGMKIADALNSKTTGMSASSVQARMKIIAKAEGYPPDATYQGQRVSRAIIDQYLPDYTDLMSNLRGFVMLDIDSGCAAPAARIASFLTNVNKMTYLYEFGRLQDKATARGLVTMGPGWYALGHVDMLDTKLVRPEDAALSLDVITMVSTFTRNGYPTWVDTNVTPPTTTPWPAYDPTADATYALMDAGFNEDNFRSRPNPEGISFWNVLLPALVGETRVAPMATTIVLKEKNDLIFDRDTILFVLIALAVLCVFFLLSMIGAFFLVYDTRRQLQKAHAQDGENKYNEAVDY